MPNEAGFSKVDLRQELERVERDWIERVLRHADWDRAEAAALLGLPLRTLARKIQALGIDKSQFLRFASGRLNLGPNVAGSLRFLRQLWPMAG